MNKTLIGIIGFLMGITLGGFYRGCVHHDDNHREIVDTVYHYVSREYDAYELPSIDLDYTLPDIPTCVYISEYKTIVKDSISYVVLPRESKYLNKDNVEIWYSGVDPSIDKLIVGSQIKEITKIVKEPFKHNQIGLFGEVGYDYGFSAPVGIEYTYSPFRWLSLGTSVEYDLYQKRYSIMESLRINLFSF